MSRRDRDAFPRARVGRARLPHHASGDYLASSTSPLPTRVPRAHLPPRATLTNPPIPPRATSQPTKTRRAARVSCSAESERAPAAAATTAALSLLVSAGAQDLSAPPASAVSTRLEGTEVAEILAEREQTSTKKAPAPKAASAPAPARKLPPAPQVVYRFQTYEKASEPKRAPVAKTDGPKLNTDKANLVKLKTDAPVAVKGGKGMQLNTEASRPKSKLAAITAGGAGLGAVFGLGKAAGTAAGKSGAGKAAAVATKADAAEAIAVLVAGGAVGQTGTSIITKNSRVRTIRKTPRGELPLPVQAAAAASVPAGFVLALLQALMSVWCVERRERRRRDGSAGRRERRRRDGREPSEKEDGDVRVARVSARAHSRRITSERDTHRRHASSTRIVDTHRRY